MYHIQIISFSFCIFFASTYNIRLVDDETYDQLLDAVKSGKTVPYSRSAVRQRRVHELMRLNAFSVGKKLNMVTGKLEMMLLVLVDGSYRIYPRSSESENIIKHFYETYKGEGARKLVQRILDTYSGITRNSIQTFLNRDPDHCKKNPIFKNKPPLQPIVSHTVNSRHQIDLVSFEQDPQVRDGKVYLYVLAVLDVFSRYLFLRPTTSKEPKEIRELLTEIYR